MITHNKKLKLLIKKKLNFNYISSLYSMMLGCQNQEYLWQLTVPNCNSF